MSSLARYCSASTDSLNSRRFPAMSASSSLTAAGGGQPGAQRRYVRRCDQDRAGRPSTGPHHHHHHHHRRQRTRPAEEHENVLGRFARGSSAAAGGSGLGLALVVQQAALHGGNIMLSDSPLGLRASLTLLTLSTEPLQYSTD